MNFKRELLRSKLKNVHRLAGPYHPPLYMKLAVIYHPPLHMKLAGLYHPPLYKALAGSNPTSELKYGGT